MDKRYQVFVSSTYADLKDERKLVIQTLLDMNCIPAGMELFPAADEQQFSYIKRVIDDCDYYLLIIGGRYGTTTAAGISYTEQEYEYAVSRGLKIIALLHENPDEIPFGKSEQDPALRAKLEEFRTKVTNGRLVKFWRTPGELPGLVAVNLQHTIQMFPAVGWTRANRAAREDVLSEINDLRKQNAQLQEMVVTLSSQPPAPIEGLARLDESFVFHLKYDRGGSLGTARLTVSSTWAQIFGYLAPYLRQHPNESYVKDVLTNALFAQSGLSGRPRLSNEQELQTVSVQLNALGLVETNYAPAVGGKMGYFYSLTPAGEQMLFQLRAVRTKQEPNSDQANR